MAINDWWAGDPAERYWMEITDRGDLGVDLNAPTLNGAGVPEWGYTLVTETRPGDIVLHWHKRMAGRPALVGWSEVTGPLSILSAYSWQARGTFGRARGAPTVGQGWRMPCGGLNAMPQPIMASRLEELKPELLNVRDLLRRKFRGPVYFPFTFYKARPMSAAQSYMTKFPAALLRVVPELAFLAPDARTRPPVVDGRGKVRRGAGNRHVQDPVLKKAIERHAVDEAKRLYRDRGATEIVELGKPYDLLVRVDGREIHVEVKGSTTRAVAVELTVNEVQHAHNHAPTELIVIDEIEYRQVDGIYRLLGGRARVWRNWVPDFESLEPTRYRYELPEN